MLIHEIFEKDPRNYGLKNQGVASVNEDLAANEETLRFEIETFVCEGQYEKGLVTILNSFLTNLSGRSEQPGIWISGYFGSGKSHLAKVLRVLWSDYTFQDRSTARGIIRVSDDVKEALKELATLGTREHGLHAAAGTLTSSANGTIRIAIAEIVARSLGLPGSWHQARFVLWLRQSEYEDRLKSYVENKGKDWKTELNNLFVSTHIAEGLMSIDSSLGGDIKEVRSLLKTQYPQKSDISNEEFLDFIREGLTVMYKGHVPLTLLVLDEIQQFIGNDQSRAMLTQEVVESIKGHFKGRLLVVGTGQNALRETPNLQRLMGRFPTPIQLSDTDVDKVLRKVILAKNTRHLSTVETLTQKHESEIARQLQGSDAAWNENHRTFLASDYPLLPGRRRFWETVLMAVDSTGTNTQLRSQLDAILQAVKQAAGEELGYIIPGDTLYDIKKSNFMQFAVLSTEIGAQIGDLEKGGPEEKLKARILKLVFLLNQIRPEATRGKGLRASQEILLDLLIERLEGDRNTLGQKLPDLLAKLVSQNALQKLPNGEYTLQTEEGQSWVQAFTREETTLKQSRATLQMEFRNRLQELVKRDLSTLQDLKQGESRVPRQVAFSFDHQPPKTNELVIWVQSGMDTSEDLVKHEAQKPGSTATPAYVFIPVWDKDEIIRALASMKAASNVLDVKGTPSTDAGKTARQAMETRKTEATAQVQRLLGQSLANATVFRGGGIEETSKEFAEKVRAVLERSLPVIYDRFGEADNPNWGTVYDLIEKKHQGAAFEKVGHRGDLDTHPVCKAILGYVGTTGKKGKDIRDNFMSPPFGWPQDAVDAGLVGLLHLGKVKVSNATGKDVTLDGWERKQSGTYLFRSETVSISPNDRIAIRSALQKDFGRVNVQSGEESPVVGELVRDLEQKRSRLGGEPPLPLSPVSRVLEEILVLSGNEQLKYFLENKDSLVQFKDQVNALTELRQAREARWHFLKEFLVQGDGLMPFEGVAQEAKDLVSQRNLLKDPDPVEPLIFKATEALRKFLNTRNQELKAVFTKEMTRLEATKEWTLLDETKREELLKAAQITRPMDLALGSPEEVKEVLRMHPVRSWPHMIDALPKRFEAALHEAIHRAQPKATAVYLPRTTVKSEAELDAWVTEVRTKVKKALESGPVFFE